MLGIGLVPYSPRGRGFPTGAVDTTDGLTQDDLRHRDPPFQGEHPERNRALVARCAAWPATAGSRAGSSRCRGCWPRTATWSRSPARSGSNAWSPQARTALGRRREPVRRPGLSALGRGVDEPRPLLLRAARFYAAAAPVMPTAAGALVISTSEPSLPTRSPATRPPVVPRRGSRRIGSDELEEARRASRGPPHCRRMRESALVQTTLSVIVRARREFEASGDARLSREQRREGVGVAR
jgi:hypothetical protein